ncbi:hypothetical protein ADK96_16035 [Streptomyces sp. IGB124]|nr:hypothetical protein ADK96_16035 [Streptomyces sp. IGB124]
MGGEGAEVCRERAAAAVAQRVVDAAGEEGQAAAAQEGFLAVDGERAGEVDGLHPAVALALRQDGELGDGAGRPVAGAQGGAVADLGLQVAEDEGLVQRDVLVGVREEHPGLSQHFDEEEEVVGAGLLAHDVGARQLRGDLVGVGLVRYPSGIGQEDLGDRGAVDHGPRDGAVESESGTELVLLRWTCHRFLQRARAGTLSPWSTWFDEPLERSLTDRGGVRAPCAWPAHGSQPADNVKGSGDVIPLSFDLQMARTSR